MAWTRYGEMGFEPNANNEWIEFSVGALNSPTISTTKFRTGARSLRFSSSVGERGAGLGFPSTTMLQANAFLNHNSISAGREAIIFRWINTLSNNNFFYWDDDTGTLDLIVNGVIQDTVDVATVGFNTTDQWFSVGIVVFADAVGGWATAYLDGIPILSATGINTGTGMTAIYGGGAIGIATPSWANYMYLDDFYVETSTIEEADSPPIPYRFLWSIANGNGSASNFDGSDGNSVDNYLLVDDVTPDEDTTYVTATAAAVQDLYAMSDIVVPVGYQISAVIPKPRVRRTGVTETIILQIDDGVNPTDESAELNPPSSYGFVWERFPLAPDGGAWTESKFNAIEIGYESAGTF